MTNTSDKVLYVGVTNSLKRRLSEHKEGNGSIFTSKYNCSKLVYYEEFDSVEEAIIREKQIKHFKRAWKNDLVNSVNPSWEDLGKLLVEDPTIV